MNRKTMMTGLVIGAICFMGCGGDIVTQGSQDLASMPLAERNSDTAYQDEKARPYFTWPADESGERDVMADIKSCREKLLSDEKYLASPNDPVRFSMIERCMTGLGWEFDPTGSQ